MTERGLVIGSPWIEKILTGEKTWEIKNKPNRRTGRIALAKKGGGLVATCMIDGSRPLSRKEFPEHFAKHRVKPQELAAFYGETQQVYAWPLSDIRPLKPPISYQHPGGGASFKISRDKVREWDRLQASGKETPMERATKR